MMNKKIISFIIVIAFTHSSYNLFYVRQGVLEVSVFELIKGLFTGTNEDVQIIKDLRLPRIIIALFAGAALSVSGVLLQAVMRIHWQNRGLSVCHLVQALCLYSWFLYFPTLFFYMPLFSFIGGAFAFLLSLYILLEIRA